MCHCVADLDATATESWSKQAGDEEQVKGLADLRRLGRCKQYIHFFSVVLLRVLTEPVLTVLMSGRERG